MTCSKGEIDREYKFIKDFENYGEILENVEKETFNGEVYKICNSLPNDGIFSKIPSSEKICKQFIFLYRKLNKNQRGTQSNASSLKEEDCFFLNYWLNDKLRGDNIDTSICFKEFYEKLKSLDSKIFNSSLPLENKLHNIDHDHFENMKIIYDLYIMKHKLYNALTEEQNSHIQNKLCSQYTKECHRTYLYGIINCRNDGSNFYSAINDFKSKYESNMSYYIDKADNCQREGFFPLPHYGDVLSEYRAFKKEQIKNILTLPILVPMLAVFFSLTSSKIIIPYGKHLYEKIKRIKNMLTIGNERKNELLLNFSQNENRILDQEEYNISYYYVGND
ncbi:PIR Superfamily Protein [Plasmodium ovale wallikeri]|uniref:PIR Superfamily Protein n=2 Tax=Plasmodium ovale TaxID=36330 RepID=A0A1A9AG54_PLAOA|nr:PIR Superfamily Protein [Plasmodium ovale wallikeri]SBT55534.1 PIR Superfamily Protein [Plasmodium ovale wallikeri]SBT74125.1 PIR protein [Plasmodium ovale]